MSFTDTWDNAVPAGTEQANKIDDHIRRLRKEIQERMDSRFVEDWTADPLVVKDSLVPTKAVIKRGQYNDALAAGSRATGYGDVVKILTVLVSGHADGSSFISVDLDEFNDADTANAANYFHVSNLLGLSTMFGPGSSFTEGRAELWDVNTGTNVLRFQAFTRHDVNAANGSLVVFYLTMYFGA